MCIAIQLVLDVHSLKDELISWWTTKLRKSAHLLHAKLSHVDQLR